MLISNQTSCFFCSPEDVWSQGRRKVQIFGGKRAIAIIVWRVLILRLLQGVNRICIWVFSIFHKLPPESWSNKRYLRTLIKGSMRYDIYIYIQKAPKFAMIFLCVQKSTCSPQSCPWEGLVPICQSCYQGISSKAGEGHESGGNRFPRCSGPVW